MVCSLVVNGLKVQLGSSKILEGVELRVDSGEMLGILGPNGSGKTTLLKCISRSIAPAGGEVLVCGRPAREYSNQQYSRTVSAMLPQWPSGFSMTSGEIVLMGCRNQTKGVWWEGEQELEVAKAALKVLNALELYDRDFDTLSSGEQRKVLIAKSLAQRTGIIVLDEPVAYLDMKHKLEVMNVLRALADRGKTVLVTLHEIDLASKYCENVVVLSHGRVVAAGKPREVITPELLSSVYGVDAIVKWDEEIDYPVIVPRTTRMLGEEVSCLR
ncbi:MAG: ABC transporter ATP-binding protein [Candidatus Verstraetearchaeota archaeon]|nr:ABC transporter ATP-binding protein [Candidatus Verstraetearchaeota archaeon]